MDDDMKVIEVVEMPKLIWTRFILFDVMLFIMAILPFVMHPFILIIILPSFGFFILHYSKFIGHYTVKKRTRWTLHLALLGTAVLAAVLGSFVI
jgi:hypothetical protein